MAISAMHCKPIFVYKTKVTRNKPLRWHCLAQVYYFSSTCGV